MSIQRETVEQRKALPLASGVLDYFPDALLAVAEVSRVGNEQHHPGEPLHWDKSKSTDEADALLRHLLDRGTRDTDGMRHSAKVAWRALALLQRELDAEAAAVEDETDPGPTAWPYPGDDDRLHAALLHLPPITEPWGLGDGPVYGTTPEGWLAYGHLAVIPDVENRGEWPPDTRVNGRLTCCGQEAHPEDCPHYR